MNYTNREVVRRLKQYDMFLNSLDLAVSEEQKERICDQLDKIEKQILLVTNNEYEEQYKILLGEETSFFAEEKSRLHKLISLIMERKKYLEDRKNKHKKITGSLVELTTFLGEDKLAHFKKRLGIIEKYQENKVRQENLIKEMKVLDVKLSEASRIVKSNTRLNDILENKMREIVSKALDKFNLYTLNNKKDEIHKSYETYEYAFKLAKDNLNTARNVGSDEKILECDEMLSEIAAEYSKYEEKINILKLIEIYDNSVSGYDELLEKREKMNEILKNISDSLLYGEIFNELSKQYNTIKLEKQDIENYDNLKQEREIKNKTLYDIEEENNSKEFKLVIDELLKNENRVREEKIRKAKQAEYHERQKKILEEQKIEASRVRRQKLIEEARLKEQQERLSKVKELQEKTVINSKKEENIKVKVDSLPNKKIYEEISLVDNDFDTDELFENTRIVPNKVLNDKTVVLDDTKMDNNVNDIEENKDVLWEETSVSDVETSSEVSDVSDMEIIDLFKEEPKEEKVDLSIDVMKKQDVQSSIYDILENNKNVIWKTTDTGTTNNNIPVIGNNNLKPEILDNKNASSVSFPELNNRRDGDILWKETL